MIFPRLIVWKSRYDTANRLAKSVKKLQTEEDFAYGTYFFISLDLAKEQKKYNAK